MFKRSMKPGKLAAPIVATLLAVVCMQVHAEKVVKIGASGPYSGSMTSYGKDYESGVRLAIDDANAAKIKIGGEDIRFELVSEDDAGDPKQAVSAATILVDKGVAGVVGHLNSGCSIPASKVYNAAGIPQVSPSSTNPMLTRQGYKTVFRVIGDDSQVGEAVGNYMVKTLGLKNVAIIDDRTAFAQGLAEAVSKNVVAVGGTVIAREYTTDKSIDFKAILSSIKSKKAEAVFYGGSDMQAGPLRRQMSELAIKTPFFSSAIGTDQFIQLAGKDIAEGTVSAEAGQAIEKMPGGLSFKERLEAKYGKIVLYSPYAYDATNVLINAMKAANSADPKKYLPEVSKVNFTGVTGHIAFKSSGDLTSPAVTLFRAKDGKFVDFQSVKTGE